jgi:hypothetical protein
MYEGKTGFKQLLSAMPEVWKVKAKELGASVRGREIKNAIDLLRLVFLYLTEGKSFTGRRSCYSSPMFVRSARDRYSPGSKNAGNGCGGCAKGYSASTQKTSIQNR